MEAATLDRLWNLSPQSVVLLDRQGRVVQANRAAALGLGLADPDGLVGTDYFAHLPARLAEARRARMAAVLDPATSEETARTITETGPPEENGARTLIRCTMMPLCGAFDPASDGAPILAVFEDRGVAPGGTGRERRSEARFRNAFDQAPYGMALIDTDGRWRRVNRALTDMLGRPAETLMGHSTLSVTHPEDWPRESAWLDAVLSGASAPYDAEKRFQRPDGTVVWGRMTAAMMRGPDGAPMEIVAQIADVSRQHAAENALRASESRFREAFEAAPHGMMICSLDGRFDEVNSALCRILGCDEETLLSLDIPAVTHPEDQNFQIEAVRRLLSGDVRVFSGEKRFIRPDGGVVRAHVSLALARGGDGRPRHIIAHVLDITRQVEAEGRLHEAVAAAEQALLAKTRFLAAASHDLRQPLQALNLFVSVLQGREDDPFKQDVLRKTETALGALAELMNTLLDISRLEGGAVLPDQRAFGIGRLLRRLSDEFGPVAAEAGLTLRTVMPSATLYSDPSLLEVILRNLIGNALKYTPTGGRVLVGARRQDAGRMLRLDVIDTGPGIPQDQLRLIFEDFHQVSDGGGSAGRDPGGLGLGLGIVNRVARLLGVTVTVASEPGRGARFSVLVPCHLGQDEPAGAGPAEGSLDDLEATADTVQPAPPAARARAAAHVVVVDDEAFIRESLSLLLQGWGHRVSAFAGLTDLTESLLTDTLSRPDVILADFRLPNGRTGVEAVALTRAHFRKPIPAMLLTGDIDSHQLREAGRGGLPVLRKPVRPDQLRLKLVEVIGASRRAGGKNRAGGPAP